MITLYSFRWVPEFPRGMVRDLRVRWALEEAGIAYENKLVGIDEAKKHPYLDLQPFGQVPSIEEGGQKLFESGAIVLNIARRNEALMPTDAAGIARTEAWIFAALNSIEPPIMHLLQCDVFFKGEPWTIERRPGAVKEVDDKLDGLETWLGDRDYLEGSFSAGDLLMADVLRILRYTDLVDRRPRLKAYRDRCTARPAFQKAMADQLASFDDSAVPAGW